MEGRRQSRWITWAVAGLVLSGAGCAGPRQLRELQAVARDWCQVIRASQVLPVYPLTEDLQPGDVFLVTRPIGQEARLYAGRGFLPFEQHLQRLQPLDFAAFYGRTNDPAHADEALRAAFPSYSFRVKSRAGLKLALPVQGVPLGLNLLQSGRAVGSITIAEAGTYGVSLAELSGALDTWSGHPDRRALFKALRAHARRPIYVRVVNRVYLAGSVVVSLHSQQAAGGTARGGASVEEPELAGNEADTGARLAALEQWNRHVAEALPGGTLRFAQASSRAVTLHERFERPLVIGYLAFDFPILPDGSLGAPVSTLERLKIKATPEVRLGELTVEEKLFHTLTLALRCQSLETQTAVYDRAAALLGGDFARVYQEARQQGQAADRAFSAAQLRWLLQNPKNQSRVQAALQAAWEQHLPPGTGP